MSNILKICLSAVVMLGLQTGIFAAQKNLNTATEVKIHVRKMNNYPNLPLTFIETKYANSEEEPQKNRSDWTLQNHQEVIFDIICKCLNKAGVVQNIISQQLTLQKLTEVLGEDVTDEEDVEDSDKRTQAQLIIDSFVLPGLQNETFISAFSLAMSELESLVDRIPGE